MDNSVKTSISMPAHIYAKLKNSNLGLYTPDKIAMHCLRKYLRKIKIDAFSTRPTCTYNIDTCDVKLYLWLTPEDHYSVKMYRVLTGTSVSYLVCMAINRYLEGILQVLKNAFKKSTIADSKWLKTMRDALRHIHRKVKFKYGRNNHILGLSIVMPMQGGRPPMRFHRKI